MIGNDRLAVRKTYKLYIGGAFPRSESGRSYEVSAHDGKPLAQAAKVLYRTVRPKTSAATKNARYRATMACRTRRSTPISCSAV